MTKLALTDIANLYFKTQQDSGTYGIELTDVAVAGYDAEGNAVFFTTEIQNSRAEITVADPDRYDVNKDGVVDLLDITYCQNITGKPAVQPVGMILQTAIWMAMASSTLKT